MLLKKNPSQLEFITLMASLMSIVALAIDALLPALDMIGKDIGVTDTADNQLFITMIFLGLGLGPMVFGPLSDSLGRKPVVFMGFALFFVASLICVFAHNLEVMIVGRILQGIALSAPRTISIAMVRDSYSGDFMARIMSFITVVFLLVPIVAPAFGKLVLDHSNWKFIFYIQLFFSALVCWWFWKRQPETLHAKDKKRLTYRIFIDGTREVLSHRRTMVFTLISGFITGSFMVYLSSSQYVFQVQYGLKEEFPFIFAGLAISIGLATLLNGNLVIRFGMQNLVRVALKLYFLVSCLYIIMFHDAANPPVYILLAFFAIQFFAVGFLFGNLRALAMEPIGHIAGIGAAITGLISTLMAVPISTYIGKFVTHDTVLPLFIGFSVCSFLSILLFWYVKLYRKG
ncbi:multidrug effflux MFS transporter [Robertkochia solimangrovi]|uniref:multidrug effflux MFS transporter n=1 Tax=Robertkochia solimangrovi TaxID=2213046 RepID=UPI00117BED6A|nr:multidrug effflux MFS transporter [Robertkochia solimangrovi]TRZ45272.1 Bcr/CflA family drug resistance efflux transporter [Robertkochia solimangrovi]